MVNSLLRSVSLGNFIPHGHLCSMQTATINIADGREAEHLKFTCHILWSISNVLDFWKLLGFMLFNMRVDQIYLIKTVLFSKTF